MSTWSYPTKDGPKFHKTTIMNLLLYVNSYVFFSSSSSSFESVDTFYQLPFFFFESSSIFVVVGSLINMAYLSWRNKVKKRPGVRAKLLKNYATAAGKESHMHVGGDDGGTSAWIELGDQHPDFVYTL